MCGRFNAADAPRNKVFKGLVGHPFPGETNHNTAPTETAWIVRQDAPGSEELEAIAARWWLTPYWSKTPKPKHATFNARAETLAEANSFREPFRRRRCLVPVCGYYEWQKDGRRRIPYYVRPRTGGMLLAGVWDRWRSRDRTQAITSFSIVTTAVSRKLEFLHNRQPVMLSKTGARRWMSRDAAPSDLGALLAPRIPMDLMVVPVSAYVGDPRNKESRCLEPVAASLAIDRDVQLQKERE
ncbi:MAG: SOS response-associated peptidase [Gammaproteobacteria bacterium]|nr:SOS response-associated peptidase [Gammaproteobacteria bacterium]